MLSAPSPVDHQHACRNRLLRALSAAARDRLLPHLVAIDAPRGLILFDPGDIVATVHFPCDGTIVSLVVTTAGGQAVEAGIVGVEGAVGGVASAGQKPAYTRAVVQIAGPMLRMTSEALAAARAGSPAIADLLARSADCLIAQLVQTVACNALHTLPQRLCRWLGAVHDRRGSSQIPLTQEHLAEMLGVTRSYVSVVAGDLQRRGLILYRRGRITILDRATIDAMACDCRHPFRAHFEALLPGTLPAATH